MSKSNQSFPECHILLLNNNAEESALLRSLARLDGKIHFAPHVEEAYGLALKQSFDAAVVHVSMGDYSRLKGLFSPKTKPAWLFSQPSCTTTLAPTFG